jgi:hypothetical protein
MLWFKRNVDTKQENQQQVKVIKRNERFVILPINDLQKFSRIRYNKDNNEISFEIRNRVKGRPKKSS